MPLPTPGTNDTFLETLRTQAFGTTTVALSAATAVTTDVSVGGPEYAYTLNSSASISSWAITNPTDKQRITLLIFKTLGASAITWPTNFRWNNNTPPTLGGNTTWQVIEMRYNAATGNWWQVSVAVGIPHA